MKKVQILRKWMFGSAYALLLFRSLLKVVNLICASGKLLPDIE